MKLISLGAEAAVYADEAKKQAIKRRLPKRYRIKELDDRLRLHRMRREAKVMEALLKMGVAVPKLIETDEKTESITMQLVDGRKARDALSKSNYRGICGEIGRQVGIMHASNIVHGDLTTSNMMVKDGRVFFVDFGLSLFTNKDEDKAVDLHLFRQALSSSHHEISAECFAAAVKVYKKSNSGWKAVLSRLEKVEERGRNKGKMTSFDEIAKPLQQAAKQAGLTKDDVKKAVKDVRKGPLNRIDMDMLQQLISSFKDIKEGRVRRVK